MRRRITGGVYRDGKLTGFSAPNGERRVEYVDVKMCDVLRYLIIQLADPDLLEDLRVKYRLQSS